MQSEVCRGRNAVKHVQGQSAQLGVIRYWERFLAVALRQQLTHDNDMLAFFESLHVCPESHIPLLSSGLEPLNIMSCRQWMR